MTRRANTAIPHVMNLALSGPTEHHRGVDAPVLHAAVLGWYQGHIEARTPQVTPPQMPTTFPSDEMPVPPFPAPGPDSPVRQVAAEVNDRRRGSLPPSSTRGSPWLDPRLDRRAQPPGCNAAGVRTLKDAPPA